MIPFQVIAVVSALLLSCLICFGCLTVIPFQVIAVVSALLLHVIGVIGVIAVITVVSVLLFHALTVILFHE